MLASGVLLVFLCFFLNGFEVKDSVLWYVAQCLVYSGSVFGVTVYISTKFGDVKNYFDEPQKKPLPQDLPFEPADGSAEPF